MQRICRAYAARGLLDTFLDTFLDTSLDTSAPGVGATEAQLIPLVALRLFPARCAYLRVGATEAQPVALAAFRLGDYQRGNNWVITVRARTKTPAGDSARGGYGRLEPAPMPPNGHPGIKKTPRWM